MIYSKETPKLSNWTLMTGSDILLEHMAMLQIARNIPIFDSLSL